MSKIFRLHKGASENIEGWQDTGGHLHDTFINSISDPAGADANTQITSIPTPFARMDLVRTAFRNVNLSGVIDGTTIYHRIVSDCLDIANIFFNIEALGDKIEIIEWNAGIIVNGNDIEISDESDLGMLLKSKDPRHKLLGETLKTYIAQDKVAFNFSHLGHFYLLNYKNGPDLINIIGGTSPSTLFFSSANDLSYVDVTFANDRVFDSQFCPLHKRDKDFIKFLYAFKASLPQFSSLFPDVETYMTSCFSLLSEELKDMIRGLNASVYEKEYQKIAVNAAGNNAEILRHALRAKIYGKANLSDENDFVIDASRLIEGQLPCVFPMEPFNESLRFAGGVWQKDYHKKVPAYDPKPLSERTLPNQGHVKYPYLTISDLLEPYLVRLPYPIDTGKFFDGNYTIRSGDSDHGYALPVKKEYFRYFTVEDLQMNVADGKKRIEMLQMPGGVKVILRIPIRNNRYIEMSRIYIVNQFSDKIQQPDEVNNQGIIVEHYFTVAVYPFLRISDPNVNPHYRIMLVDRDTQVLTKHNNYSLNFYDATQPVSPINNLAPRHRSNKHKQEGVTTLYNILEKNFDFIEVVNTTARALLVPLFVPQQAAGKVFKFAIDFGTTNTHIEYKVGNESPRPFDITEKDVQVGTLYAPDERTSVALKKAGVAFGAIALTEVVREEFLPFTIGQDKQYRFPQRTVICDNGSFNPDEANFALAELNIPFGYLKEVIQYGGQITSNLKWGELREQKRFGRRTRAFMKQLLLMIRNKVLMNGGELAATEIVWFYPTSMTINRRNFLDTAWTTYYNRYFGNENRIHSMSESFAPFYYYYHKENVRAHDRSAVNIDIGGGTTDIVAYKGEFPILLTSFKFASNAIFGDGYGSNANSNGFVQRFDASINQSLNSIAGNNLSKVLGELKKQNSNSIELIEFFFSLEDNKTLREKGVTLSFSNMLEEDSELKLVLVFFYGSIIYHIAQLMKAKGLEVPEYITFSGNGARLIKLTDGGNLQTLKAFSKIIFSDVFGLECPDIEFRFNDKSKEITCKGGLECTDFTKFHTLEEEIRTVLVGGVRETLIPETKLNYSQLDDEQLIRDVVGAVTLYIDKFFEWDRQFNYYRHFGVNPARFEQYRKLLRDKVRNDLQSGIKEKLKEVAGNVNVDLEETLFFYPLVGAMNRLAFQIYNETKSVNA
jgi:hypothetical protein